MDVQQDLSRHYETDIKLIGDKATLTQIVVLLSYIRYYLQSGTSGDIKVSVGKNMESSFFGLQVNDQEIPNIYPRDNVEIN